MFAEDEWKSQEAKFKSIPFTKAEARKFNRLYFSGAVEVTCDKQGRILMPRYLKDFAEIKRDVMIIGVSSRIEIWAREKWQEYYEASKTSFEEIAERLIETEDSGGGAQ
jgi:MraZ protein